MRIEEQEQTYNFKTNSKPLLILKGLTRENIQKISMIKNEPEWMRELRLKAFDVFNSKTLPTWAIADLSELDFDDFNYYLKPEDQPSRKWSEVPKDIKKTFEKLGIPQAERKILGGVVAQYESESVYNNLRKELEKKGVIFLDMDTAVQKYPEIIREYFMKCVPINDNKFSALHASVWSGGVFVYVPKNAVVELPLQSYFRMNVEREGQFEHTIIIADEGSKVHFVEGCSAPKYTAASLHSAVVEIYVKENASVKYTTVQNWSKNVYNLNTKRAIVEKNGFMQWVGGSIGAKTSILYPASVLVGENAKASHLSITLAGKNTVKEGGAKVIHNAKNTSSKIIAKSISIGGETAYRGIVRINKGAENSFSSIKCDGLVIGKGSKAYTFPHMEVFEKKSSISHEAKIGKINPEELFYLQTRGLNEKEATSLAVLGFLDEIMKEIPMEYALEFNKLIELEIEGL
jgi:Fe-S cluster assembly protein SufB